MDRVWALRVHTSKRDPVSNGHRKRHSIGTEFQASWVHNNIREPLANRHRKNNSLWTEFGPSGGIRVKGTPYRTDIGRDTV